MNEELKKAIKEEIEGKEEISKIHKNFITNNLSVSLEALNDFLFLMSNVSSDSQLNEEDFLKLLNGDVNIRRGLLNTWHIEKVLKELYRTINPDEYSNGGSNKMLEELYKYVFELCPDKIPGTNRNFSLTNIKNIDICRNEQDTTYAKNKFLGELVNLYQIRNETSVHDVKELSRSKTYSVCADLCIVLLYLSYRYKDELRKRANFKRFIISLSENWLAKEKEDYAKKVTRRIGYIDFKWEANGECSTKEIANLEPAMLKDVTYIKLIGQAGAGKTTALMRIKNIFLDNYNKDNGLIPVFFELKKLTTMKDSFLRYIVSTAYSVSEDAAGFLLESDNLIFLLDGYNEILDSEIRSKFATELEEYLDKHRYADSHKNVRVIMTDRSERNTIPVLSDKSKCLTMCCIKKDDREKYFKNNLNCPDKEIQKLLLDTLKSEPERFKVLKTPLKLFCFTKMALEKRRLPDNFMEGYLRDLIERERVDKKDINLEELEEYLTAMAPMFGLENKPVSETSLRKRMGDVDKLMGSKGYDARTALRLARDMGILSEVAMEDSNTNKECYHFDDNDYLNYYLNLYMNNDELYEEFGD